MFELEHFPWKIGTISMRRTPQQALSFITASGTSWSTSASNFAMFEEVAGNVLGSGLKKRRWQEMKAIARITISECDRLVGPLLAFDSAIPTPTASKT